MAAIIKWSEFERELEVVFKDLASPSSLCNSPLSYGRFLASLSENLFISPSLNPPQLVPGDDGSVQLEWHQKQYDIEIKIYGLYDVEAYRHNLRTGEEETIKVTTDFTVLAEWVKELYEAN